MAFTTLVKLLHSLPFWHREQQQAQPLLVVVSSLAPYRSAGTIMNRRHIRCDITCCLQHAFVALIASRQSNGDDIRAQRLQGRSLTARAAAVDQELIEEGGLLEGQGRLVQWYPGHIARAERRLQEQLSQVDAVLEVRDAR